MSQELRIKLLRLLEEHSRTGSNKYKSDSDLAKESGVSVGEVQKQLEILEMEELIKLEKVFGAHNAIISSKGSLTVEQIDAQTR